MCYREFRLRPSINSQGNAILLKELRPAQTTRERKKVNLVHACQSSITKLSESDVEASIGFAAAKKLSCERKIISFGLDIVRFPSYLRLTINKDFSRKVFTREKRNFHSTEKLFVNRLFHPPETRPTLITEEEGDHYFVK